MIDAFWKKVVFLEVIQKFTIAVIPSFKGFELISPQQLQ